MRNAHDNGLTLELDPISPDPVRGSERDSAPAYLSNGVIGLSLGFDPLQDTACVVSGLSKTHPEGHYETQAFVPFPFQVQFSPLNSEYADPFVFEVGERRYDFSTGEFTADGHVVSDSGSFRCKTTTWCSRSLPNVVVQELQFDSKIRCTTRPRLEGVAGHRISGVEGALHWSVPGGDRVGIAVVQVPTHRGIVQVAAIVPKCMHPRPDMQAARILAIAVARGAEQLKAENRAAWQDLWIRRVPAPYAEGQAAVDAAFFYLNSSVHQASPNSTGLFGLCPPTRYHNFNQHLFWDLETHALPALLSTQPEAARSMLEARFRGIESARSNASMNGYRGIQFPWEAGTKGQEELPIGASAMLHEQHITLCVAEAFVRASSVFGEAFTREKVWPILNGVADWLESRISHDKDGAHIRTVIGIGEGMANHDDNVWTNALAKSVLRSASQLHSRMGYGENRTWNRLAADLLLPMRNGALTVHPKYSLDADFCPEQLMVIFPLQAPLPEDVKEATLGQYLKTAMVSMGMPMHSPYHWIWAKMAGDEDHARLAFERGVLSFVFQPFNLIDEFGAPYAQSKRRVGPYLAHCGAILHGALYFQNCLKMHGELAEAR